MKNDECKFNNNDSLVREFFRRCSCEIRIVENHRSDYNDEYDNDPEVAHAEPYFGRILNLRYSNHEQNNKKPEKEHKNVLYLIKIECVKKLNSPLRIRATGKAICDALVRESPRLWSRGTDIQKKITDLLLEKSITITLTDHAIVEKLFAELNLCGVKAALINTALENIVFTIDGKHSILHSLFFYDCVETGRNCLVFTNDFIDEEGYIPVYSAFYQQEKERLKLILIEETDLEWHKIKTILEETQNTMRNLGLKGFNIG